MKFGTGRDYQWPHRKNEKESTHVSLSNPLNGSGNGGLGEDLVTDFEITRRFARRRATPPSSVHGEEWPGAAQCRARWRPGQATPHEDFRRWGKNNKNRVDYGKI